MYRYLKSKGYKDQILKETGLVNIEERGTYDKFWNRVMFPILDVNNRVIGFGAVSYTHLKHIFRGAGAYHHYIPAIVKSVTTKEDFVTAYTPYQAEISHCLLYTSRCV